MIQIRSFIIRSISTIDCTAQSLFCWIYWFGFRTFYNLQLCITKVSVSFIMIAKMFLYICVFLWLRILLFVDKEKNHSVTEGTNVYEGINRENGNCISTVSISSTVIPDTWYQADMPGQIRIRLMFKEIVVSYNWNKIVCINTTNVIFFCTCYAAYIRVNLPVSSIHFPNELIFLLWNFWLHVHNTVIFYNTKRWTW